MAGTALKIAQALGHRLDALLASAIGLLTLISWHLHDASPLATLDRGTSAVGLDISAPLTTAGTWLHDEVHRSWLVPVSLVILGGALAHQMWRLARDHSELAAAIRAEDPEALRRHHRFVGACEVRFWSIAWVVTGLLAEVGFVTPRQALLGLGVILAARLVAELRDWVDVTEHFGGRYRDDLGIAIITSIIGSLVWAAMTLASLFLWVGGRLFQPAMR